MLDFQNFVNELFLQEVFYYQPCFKVIPEPGRSKRAVGLSILTSLLVVVGVESKFAYRRQNTRSTHKSEEDTKTKELSEVYN